MEKICFQVHLLFVLQDNSKKKWFLSAKLDRIFMTAQQYCFSKVSSFPAEFPLKKKRFNLSSLTVSVLCFFSWL